MLIDRRRGDQDDTRVVSYDLGVSDDFFQVGLVLLQWDVLLVGSIWEGSIVGAEENGLLGSVACSTDFGLRGSTKKRILASSGEGMILGNTASA
jgi:hypothetical protein